MGLNNLLSDTTIDAMRREGNCRRVQGVEIVLPAEFGFCGGVHRALQIVEQTLNQQGNQRIWLLGELIHNDRVNRYFRDRGVKVIPEGAFDQLFEKVEPGDTLVIPAFGIPTDVEEALFQRYGDTVKVEDATCAYVRRVWDFVRRMAAAQRTVIIHGKPGHAEVRAILSRSVTPENTAVLVPDVEKAQRLAQAINQAQLKNNYPEELILNPAAFSPQKLALANQTTMLKSETRQIEQILRDVLGTDSAASLECLDTLCSATQTRQDAATELCTEGCDVVLVVGSPNSSNTTQLYRIAGEYNTRTYFIASAEAFNAESIRHYHVPDQQMRTDQNWLPDSVKRIGIMAGASCPVDIVGDVVRRLESLLS